MPITLQSTVGGFSREFIRRLPELEQAMIAHGLEPAEFVISKDRATPPSVPFIGPFFYDYTVFIGGENFTVTEPNDIRFPGLFPPACHRRGCGGAGTATGTGPARPAPRPDPPRRPMDGAADLKNVLIPGHRAAMNPESRDKSAPDSPMCNCTSEVRAKARPGMTKSFPPLSRQGRQRAAFAIARVLVVDPVVRVDPLGGMP